ncbi:hypothetical protein EI555_010113 [Monodon monoceros]|uniref:Small ribosomal subunit protein uS2 C-terminal domain-containing protein n=1 Tax=Monodon monoceros TaxID=40151 RepID=A0A4V6WP77_MONMO|nr:hypothetical protein EI555_010113 [Monodon monoceros]
MRGTIFREHPWEVMPDLYFYRDPEETEMEEQAAAEKAVTKEEFQGEWTAPPPELPAPQPEAAGGLVRRPVFPSGNHFGDKIYLAYPSHKRDDKKRAPDPHSRTLHTVAAASGSSP